MSTLFPTIDAGIASGVQVVAVAVGGPVLVGAMRKVRCRLEGRVGPPILQPLIDIRKLFRKQRLRPDQATWIFPLAPVVLVATVAVAAVIAPLVTTHPAFGTGSDLFVLVYLLLVGSTLLALAGLDAGTAFGGMGSSRAVTIGALAEPALLVTILALSATAHSSNLPAIVRATLADPGSVATPQRLFALGSLLIVIVAESGRLPVDNPATHLELTMVHEAMILEYAGPDLALVTVGEAMRLTLLLGVFVNLRRPLGRGHDDASVGHRDRTGFARRQSGLRRCGPGRLRGVHGQIAPVQGSGVARRRLRPGAARSRERAGRQMSTSTYASALGLEAAAVLLCAVVTLWRRSLGVDRTGPRHPGLGPGVCRHGHRSPSARRWAHRRRPSRPGCQGGRRPGPHHPRGA